MGKFYGEIGYAETIETSPGVWEEIITERHHYGDILRNVQKINDGEKLNDDLTIDNRLSIVSDEFSDERFHYMRYVKWMGSLWKIKTIEIQRPRLILTIGGIYNE